MKNVILINGLARSGKDTIAKYMKEELNKREISTEILSFAEPLKQIIADTFDISLTTLEYYKNNADNISIECIKENRNDFQVLEVTNFRRILQRFGTEGMKPVFGNNVWANLVVQKIKQSNAEVFIIPDFRFQIEADTILKLENEDIAYCRFMYIHSDMSTISENKHISENDLKDFEFDYIINNMKDKLHETKFCINELLFEMI